MATCGDIVGIQLNDRTGEDSQSIYPILLDENKSNTEAMPIVHHSSKGFFAVRKGDWKLIEKRGSGGFSIPVVIEPNVGDPMGQLYNIGEDPSETNNLYNEKPELVKELLDELENIRNH
jgi:arylsulfatase A-like enzyme